MAMSTPTDDRETLFDPPAPGAWETKHTYFQAKHYGPMEHMQLHMLATNAQMVAGSPSLDASLSPHSHAYRQRAKQNILALVSRLNSILPLAIDDLPIEDALYEIRTSKDPEYVAGRVDQMMASIRHTMQRLTPPHLPADYKNEALLSRQNIAQQLRYMREIYDAMRQENGNSNMDVIPDSQLLHVARGIHTTLALNSLIKELDTILEPYQHAINRPNLTRDRADLEKLAVKMVHSKVGQFNGKFTGTALRHTPLSRKKEDAALELKTVGDAIQQLAAADDMGTVAGCVQQLRYFVARRAYFIQADMAQAYTHDFDTMNKTVARRGRRDERVPNNPFHGHEEAIRAGYEAKWCETAQTVLGLMRDFEVALKDPKIIASSDANVTRPAHQVGTVKHVGRTAKSTGARGRGADTSTNPEGS